MGVTLPSELYSAQDLLGFNPWATWDSRFLGILRSTGSLRPKAAVAHVTRPTRRPSWALLCILGALDKAIGLISAAQKAPILDELFRDMWTIKDLGAIDDARKWLKVAL